MSVSDAAGAGPRWAADAPADRVAASCVCGDRRIDIADRSDVTVGAGRLIIARPHTRSTRKAHRALMTRRGQ
ncbi:hypothetical protein [Halosolutus halophilus]|uniref:hypothetical protein n=1 Tax=Halosolutus halophilus TaxID=1552990 RepID=UPI00223522E6|nr:hypothetical protein [Halosolutus halophilus]